MRQPQIHIPLSFLLVIPFIAGIYWQANTNPIFVIALSIAVSTSLLSLANATKATKVKIAIILLVFFTIGAMGYKMQQDNFHQFYTTHNNSPFDIIGTIDSHEQSSHTYCKSRLTLHISSIKPCNKEIWRDVSATVYINTSKQSSTPIEISDTSLVRNVTFKKSSNTAYNNFLIKEKCTASLFIPKLDYQLLNRPAYSFMRWLKNYKRSLLDRLQEKFSCGAFRSFAAIFLGNRLGKNNLKDTRPYFKVWGLLHYLARSGLHLIFFIALLCLLFTLIPISFFAKQLILIVVIIAYSMLSWTSIPFNRALHLFIFQKIGLILNFQINTIHLLSCICLITLFQNPSLLFFLDFQLSFGITFALAYFNVLNEKNYQ